MQKLMILLSVSFINISHAMQQDDNEVEAGPFNFSRSEDNEPVGGRRARCSWCNICDFGDTDLNDTSWMNIRAFREFPRARIPNKDNTKVGYATMSMKDPCYLLRFFVHSEAEKKGLDKKLLEQILGWSKSKGCDKVYTIVREEIRAPESSQAKDFRKLGAKCSYCYYDHRTKCEFQIPK